mgnify:CR=1 FL=1|jgi:hypothetical protein
MEQENPPKDGNTFFSSGAYGCVHYPRIKCDGTQKSNRYGRKDGLLSKLVLYDSKTENEYLIGKKLKATSMLKDNPIVIVERKCEINPNGANKIARRYPKCDKVLRRKKDKIHKYMLLFSKYYKSDTANDYIYNSKHFSVHRVLKYFYFCVYVSNILKSFNVVHNDMHLKNVIYNKKTRSFHLIDFGLSLDIDKIYSSASVMEKETLNYNQLKTSLVSHNAIRPTWTIEHHILIHFVFRQRSLDARGLTEIVDKYYEFFKESKWLLNVDDYENYKMEVYKHYHNLFVNQVNIETHMITIITEAAHSWDVYRVASACLNAIERFKSEISSSKFRIEEFRFLLQTCLHYDYKMRPSPEKLLKTISSLSLI